MKAIVLHEMTQDGLFHCCLCEWDEKTDSFKEVMSAAHERALYAFLDCKRDAILAGKWNERSEYNNYQVKA